MSVRKDGHVSVFIQDREHLLSFEKDLVPRKAGSARLKGKGKGDLQKSAAALKIEHDPALDAQGQQTARKVFLPHDAQGGVGADESADPHGNFAAAEVEFDFFRRRKEKIFVKAEAHGRISGRLEFAENAVHGCKFDRALEAVHDAEVHTVDEKGAGQVG